MELKTAPTNVWLIAGTSAFEPYPCRCEPWREGGCSARWCPCSGRTDYGNVPASCCCRVNTPAVAAAAQSR
jgi:hypothetical protein